MKCQSCKTALILFVLYAVSTATAAAQIFTKIATFEFSNGDQPYAPLVQGADGNFYGTTLFGGDKYCTRDGCGLVFEVDPGGTLRRLYTFETQAAPMAPLLLANNGNFYGTTTTGEGYSNDGDIFTLTPGGVLTPLYDFCMGTPCGGGPSGLTRATDGNFYGTTGYGGSNCSDDFGCGTVFRFTPAGKLATLYDFCTQSNCNDGANPAAGLVQGVDGNFYGTTEKGGAKGYGTVFRITPSGALRVLHSFYGTDGAEPLAGLVQASDGNFYGTTWRGGDFSCMPGYGGGTVFRITPKGKLTTLHTFHCAEGAMPSGQLIQATDGNLYGTTQYGGIGGTVFEISLQGNLTMLYTFCSQPNCADGDSPFAGLVQDTDGKLYGTATFGGDLQCDLYAMSGCGTVFNLDVGLGPFIGLVQNFGRVGGVGGILGQGFIGTTAVSLNGTAADFTVVSDTFIKATVPRGATSGYVTVTTPGGILKSNVPFQVIP